MNQQNQGRQQSQSSVFAKLRFHQRGSTMLNLISRMIDHIGLLTKQSAKKLSPLFPIGILLLTTNADSSISEQKLSNEVDRVIHQDNEKRPKTTGEWNQQSRETQGKPGNRIKRVGEQSAEAIKDFGSIFPDTVKRSTTGLKNSSKASK